MLLLRRQGLEKLRIFIPARVFNRYLEHKRQQAQRESGAEAKGDGKGQGDAKESKSEGQGQALDCQATTDELNFVRDLVNVKSVVCHHGSLAVLRC